MNQYTIEQILPSFITREIKCKKAICVSVDKNKTKSIMDQLKNPSYCLNKILLIKEANANDITLEEFQMRSKDKDNNNNSNKYKEYDCSFLKRVKSINAKTNHILIGFEENFKYNNKEDSEIENDLGITKENWIYYDIPYTQPITDEQYNYCKVKWIISHFITSKDKYVYSHNQNESDAINQIASELNQKYDKDQIECLLYDPNAKAILATGKRIDDIINHSIMNLLDNYCNPKVIQSSIQTSIGDKDSRVSLGQKQSKGSSETTDFLLGNCDQYYCEGLYVFSIYEPCIMCSMALVHNRISRIYFMKDNLKDGGLISKILINNYNINSHYLVFKIK